MSQRDPETGKFTAADDNEFDRMEEVHHEVLLSAAAADLDGATGQHFGEENRFEGLELVDLDDVVDRDEVAIMSWAEHTIDVYAASTATADTTVRAAIEISASPSRNTAGVLTESTPIADQVGQFDVDADHNQGPDVTSDLIGRVLSAIGHGPITDGSTGVGGAGSAGKDWWEGQPAANPVFDARDALYLNGAIEVSNASDLSIHCDVNFRHVYGIMEDFY